MGYRYITVHDGGGQARFEPIPEQVEVVRNIFEWIGRERCTLAEVCRRLQGAGKLTEQKQVFEGAAHAFYGKPKLRIPDTYENDANKTAFGQFAFIDYISPTQVNAQVPSNVGTGLQPVIVTTTAGANAPYTIMVNAAQPGLLAPSSFSIGGKQYVVALFSDGATFVLPPGAIAGVPSRPTLSACINSTWLCRTLRQATPYP